MADAHEWKVAEQSILDRLDIASEYRQMGAVFTRDRPTPKGWLACHAFGRKDDNASAAVFVGGGPARGRYKDMGGEGLSLSLWEFAARFGKYADWKDARRSFAEKAGVTLPGGAEPKRPTDRIGLKDTPAADAILANWAAKTKGGFDLQTVKENGGRYASFPKNAKHDHAQDVVAFPAYNPPGMADSEPSAWVIANITGNPVRVFRGKDKAPTESKTISVGGSVGSVLGVYGMEHLGDAEVVWKVEGLTDLLTLHHALREAGLLGKHVVISNSQGSLERVKPEWVKMLAGKRVHVVHDRDRPGQTGAERWARALAGEAAKVRNVALPYAVKDSHGEDVRDFLFRDGHAVAELIALAEQTPAAALLVGGESQQRHLPLGGPGGRAAEVANCDPDGKVGLPILAIARGLRTATGGWPRRVGGALFAATPAGDAPLELKDANALFAWMSASLGGSYSNPVRWAQGAGMVSKGEFFAHLTMNADAFDAVERLPHEPPLPRHYYLHPRPAGGDGEAFGRLLAFFRPATAIDARILRAAFLTPFWGGQAGKRPAFLVTTDEDHLPGKGRGVGKTAFVDALARLTGGLFAARAAEDADQIKTRLLSPSALGMRVARLDNLKAHRFSSADVEELITSGVISGRKLYQGEGRIPNVLTWFLTMNGASVSLDMAQRLVVLKLSRPPYRPTWATDVARLVEGHRWEIIGDILAALRSDACPPAAHARWPEWEAEVLGRCGDADAVMRELALRRTAIDDDRSDSEVVRDYIVGELRRRGHCPLTQVVHFTAAQAHPIVNAATGERRAVNAAGKYLRSLHIPELSKCDRANAKGWEWRGASATADTKAVALAPTAEERALQIEPPPESGCPKAAPMTTAADAPVESPPATPGQALGTGFPGAARGGPGKPGRADTSAACEQGVAAVTGS